jgi:hypothetical protein
MTTPRRPRLESSSTAQIRLRALVWPAIADGEAVREPATIASRPRRGRAGGGVEDLPPARLQLAVAALGQLGSDVAKRVHRAALLSSAEIVLLEPALAPAPIALARVLTDPGDRRLADHRLIEGLRQRRLDLAHRQPTQQPADDQQLQRERARHAPAKDPALEPELAPVAHARTLEPDRTRGPHHPPRPIALAVAHRIDRAHRPRAPEKPRPPVLERLPQDQPRTQPTDPLHRISLTVNASHHTIKLAAKPLTRDHSRHASVPPSASTAQVKAEATPALLPVPTGPDEAGGPPPQVLRATGQPPTPNRRWTDRHATARRSRGNASTGKAGPQSLASVARQP